MSRRRLTWLCIAGLAVANAGCATITKGTSQSINIDSQPAGADCTFAREGEPLGTVKTPGVITVKRDAKAINVVCAKDGYEEGRAIMNSRAESATYGNAIVGGAIGMMVDMSTGASNRYESSLNVELTPMSEADRAVAAARPKMPPTPSIATAVPPSGAGSLDGEYEGDVELVQRSGGKFIRHMRHFEVRVVGASAKGTIKHPSCTQPGDVELTIDPAGHVKGMANTLNTDGCTSHKATLEGRVDGKDIRLTITREGFAGWTTDFSLVRKSPPQTSEARPPAWPRNSSAALDIPAAR